jgi:cold shock CspA family protein
MSIRHLDKRIDVKVSQNTVPLPVEEDGFLGMLTASHKIELVVTVDPRASNMPGKYLGISINSKHNATSKHNHGTDEKYVFKATIPVYDKTRNPDFDPRKKDSKDNPRYIKVENPFTLTPQNQMKLIRLFKNGRMQIWEISVVTRKGDFFLVIELVWDVKHYRSIDGDHIVCPALYKWGTLLSITTLHPKLENLEHVNKYEEPEEITADGLPDGQGRVQWWNNSLGYGGIVTHNGPAFIHYENISSNGSRLISLQKRQVVTFTTLKPIPIQRRSKYSEEAVGVTL